ncbi:MAG: glucosamine-6-phosphate deaminase [Firmicutes bacterium]|jgi:glucosamine-6-phosphate deaminase|nr:glucosamine-6-phosphate deaminase [Bacillota bacterium]NLO65973.1 glucosamine-6-phosphate deaminase [Bacillota bacterium]
MKIIVVSDYERMSEEVAKIVQAQIAVKPDSVLGLATGSTPLGTYRKLVEMAKDGLDFSQVTTFNLDEYVGLAGDHPQSYRYYMEQNLFSGVNIPREKTFIPNGTAADLAAECAAYEEKIKGAGGIDLQLLGIGSNAHIGFNEPGSEFGSTTRLVDLAESTIEDNSRFFASREEVPTQAISMGIKSIMQAKQIVLMANGENKADAIWATVLGPVTSDVPASVLQLHPFVTLVLDEAAASKL